MRLPISVKRAARSGACGPVLAAATVLLSAACGEREEVTEPAPSPTPGGVPLEVIRAGEEADDRDGQVIFLKQINPKTGAVVRGRAQFVPSVVSADKGHPALPRRAAVTTQTQPADHPNPYVTVAPSGLRLPRTIFGQDSTFRGSLNVFCYYSGQWHQMTDFYVDSLTVTAVANTGGHEDAGHTGQKPKGRTSRPDGPSDVLGEWPFTYYADSTAGDDHLLFYYTVNDTDEPAFCRGPKPPGPPYVFAKRWWSVDLVQITPQGGLTYPAPTSEHFDINYAASSTAEKTYQVAEFYRVNFPTGTVRLTAATLIYGGLQDVANNWTGENRPRGLGHTRHRIGTDVDLNAGGYESREAIKTACTKAGFIHAVHESQPPHVHCYDFYY